MATGKQLATIEGHTDWQCSVAFSPDGKTLAEGTGNRTIVAVGCAHSENPDHFSSGTWIGYPNSVAPLPKQEVSVAYCPDGKSLASENIDKTAHLWDVATGKPRATFKEGLLGGPSIVAFSPDGKTLASCGGNIFLWDLQTHATPISLKDDQTLCLAFSPEGKTLASGSQSGMIKLWNVKTGAEQGTLNGSLQPVWSIAYSPDGKTLASGHHDKKIRLWDLSTAK